MNLQDIFGTIKPPISSIPDNPTEAIGALISTGIHIFIFVAAIAMMIYLLLGAFEWIVSGGEKEKITKAQLKITNAVVGIVVIIAVLAIFNLITVKVLHIFEAPFQFKIPTL